MHRRIHPKRNEFFYRVFLFCLDLDEVDRLAGTRSWGGLVGWNRAGIFSFYNKDHLGKISDAALRPRIDAWLSERGVPRPAKILYLTNLRIFGYVFNPISIFFCFDALDEPLASVAQVGNTFGEQKLYLVPAASAGREGWEIRTPKEFYVSPFSDLDMAFDFRFRVPGKTLHIRIDDWQGEKQILISRLTGKEATLCAANLFWFLGKYPLLTLRIIFLIHWHALLLWLKKIPHHRKESNPHLQRGILNPGKELRTGADHQSSRKSR